MASKGWTATDTPFPNRDARGEGWLQNSLGDVPYRHTFLGQPVEWGDRPTWRGMPIEAGEE